MLSAYRRAPAKAAAKTHKKSLHPSAHIKSYGQADSICSAVEIPQSSSIKVNAWSRPRLVSNATACRNSRSHVHPPIVVIGRFLELAIPYMSPCPPRAARLPSTAARTRTDISESERPPLSASRRLRLSSPKRQTFRFPSDVMRRRLHVPQKCSLMDVMNPTLTSVNSIRFVQLRFLNRQHKRFHFCSILYLNRLPKSHF